MWVSQYGFMAREADPSWEKILTTPYPRAVISQSNFEMYYRSQCRQRPLPILLVLHRKKRANTPPQTVRAGVPGLTFPGYFKPVRHKYSPLPGEPKAKALEVGPAFVGEDDLIDDRYDDTVYIPRSREDFNRVNKGKQPAKDDSDDEPPKGKGKGKGQWSARLKEIQAVAELCKAAAREKTKKTLAERAQKAASTRKKPADDPEDEDKMATAKRRRLADNKKGESSKRGGKK